MNKRSGFRSDLLVAATTALLSAAALFLIWEDRAGEEQDRATGELLADLAARASIDGLIDQDRIELGVVANRLTGVPRVSGVAMFTVENQLLALSGSLENGKPFIQPIVLDDMVLGYARIGLASPSRAPDTTRLASSVLALLMAALLVAWWSHRMRGGRRRPFANTAAGTDSATEAVHQYLLVANLHNQFSLSRSERDRAAGQALAAARRVGEIYQCRSRYLPGTGLLMTFPAQAGHPTAFEAVCAAFLVAEILARDASSGAFRFGLHALEQRAGESAAVYPDALEDTALLAALGKSGAIVASEAFMGDLAEPERIKAEAFSHPMLEQLHNPKRSCHLITDLGEDHRTLIDRQASHLAASAVDQN